MGMKLMPDTLEEVLSFEGTFTPQKSDSIFIKGNVPSSKNNKQVFAKYGKVFFTDSPQTKRYRKETVEQYRINRDIFLSLTKDKPLPLNVRFKFTRDTRRLFDFVNMAQVVLDLMTEYGWISDDNYTIINPSFDPVVIIDKINPGVKIKVL